MRFAGNQQNSQAFPHPIDNQHSAVVLQGQLVRSGINLQFQHGGPTMVQAEREVMGLANGYGSAIGQAAVTAQTQPSVPTLAASAFAVFHPQSQVQNLADDTIAGRLHHYQAAVPLAPLAAQ